MYSSFRSAWVQTECWISTKNHSLETHDRNKAKQRRESVEGSATEQKHRHVDSATSHGPSAQLVGPYLDRFNVGSRDVSISALYDPPPPVAACMVISSAWKLYTPCDEIAKPAFATMKY